MAQRRLQKELQDLQKEESANSQFVRDVIVDDTNIFEWKFTILPANEPYNVASFVVEMKFPQDYPFKPPTLKFLTPIYHPNVDEKGGVCLPLILPDNWKPAIKIDQVIQSLVALVNSPEPDHALRADLAEEFTKNRPQFNRKAEEHAKKNAGRR